MRPSLWKLSKLRLAPSQAFCALLGAVLTLAGLAALLHFLKQPVLAASVSGTKAEEAAAASAGSVEAEVETEAALALESEAASELVGPQLPDLREMVVRLTFPVSWQLSRTRNSGAVTESFRESWLWEVRPGGTAFLQSSRARVPVLPAGAFDRSESVLPGLVYISESHLARLLGIPKPAIFHPAGAELGFIALHLSHGQRGLAEVTLTLGEDDRCEVRIEVGDQPTFF